MMMSRTTIASGWLVVALLCVLLLLSCAVGGAPSGSCVGVSPPKAVPLLAGHAPAATGTPASPTNPPLLAFADARHGWAALGLGLLATTDGGDTWCMQATVPSPIDALDVLDRRTVWAATTGGLLQTTDGGLHWTALSSAPANLRSVDFVSASHGWAVTGGGTLLELTGPPLPLHGGQLQRTIDGGQHWTPVSAVPGAQSICFADAQHGWVGRGAELWQTSNAGATWQLAWTAPLGDAGGWYAQVACVGSSVWTLFVGEGAASSHKPYALFRRADGGSAWTALLAEVYMEPSYPALRALEGPGTYPGPLVVPASATALFLGWSPAGTGSLRLARTTDGGQHWSMHLFTQLSGVAPGHAGMAFVGAKHGWIITGPPLPQQVFRTSDGGETWRVSAVRSGGRL